MLYIMIYREYFNIGGGVNEGGERITALGKHRSAAVTSEPACVFSSVCLVWGGHLSPFFPTVMQGRAEGIGF